MSSSRSRERLASAPGARDRTPPVPTDTSQLDSRRAEGDKDCARGRGDSCPSGPGHEGHHEAVLVAGPFEYLLVAQPGHTSGTLGGHEDDGLPALRAG